MGTTPASTFNPVSFMFRVVLVPEKKKISLLLIYFLPSQEPTVTPHYKSYQVLSSQLHYLIPPSPFKFTSHHSLLL